MFRAFNVVGLFCLCFSLCAGVSNADDLLLSDFNNSGFDYSWEFGITPGPTAVRLTDLTQGWGGAGINQSLDLSAFADGRVVVDFERHPQNGVSVFEIELYDSNGVSGKWPFSLFDGPVSEVAQRAHSNTLANPVSGVGNFENLDLSNIVRWQILGEWESTSPFDVSFDNVSVSTTAAATPRTYPGQDADAPWRLTADDRIDQIRKADLLVKVVDANGVTVPHATVNVEMQQHEFGFGSAVATSRFTGNSSDNITYRNKVEELFNQAVIENNLKWPPWEGDWGRNFTPQRAINTLEWLQERAIEARGHAMVWPGYSNLPNDVKAIIDNAGLSDTQRQQALRTAVSDHIAEIGAATDGLLRDWDVINEPRTNHDIMDILPEGNQAMVTWFEEARAIDADAKLFLNEFGILTSGGGTNTGNQQLLLSQLNDLITAGAPIDGVGLQSHFSESNLTGPEQLWEILDDFGATGLDVQITEFDFNTTDQQLQAEYTRDFITAVFAHEAVTDFMFWGFFENSHWRPDAALFDADWNIKPNGQAFIDLVHELWRTEELITADIDGEASLRGFKGDYLAEATYNFGTAGVATGNQSFQLGDGGSTVTVTLDALLGDFDGSGAYSCSDVDLLVALIASDTELVGFDITGDGTVNRDDLTAWLTYAGSDLVGGALLPGDANLDGVIDEADFVALNAHRFQSGAGWCGGDFTADGIVDVSDFNIWLTHRGQSSAGAVAAVPEPRGLGLFAFAVVALIASARRRSQS